MEGKSVFISSCSRRDLARRKPGRSPSAIALSGLLVLVAVALFLAVHGL